MTEADARKQWLVDWQSRGATVVVPEIVDYELRRELVRSGKTTSVSRLDSFLNEATTTFLRLNTDTMRRAAALCATARSRGLPTANPDALDVDVILAAQVIEQGWPAGEFVVASSNVGHLAQFVPSANWTQIV